MIQKLKIAILSLVSLFAFAAPAMMVASTAYAADTPAIQNSVCSGAKNLSLDSSGTCASVVGGENCDFNCVLTKVINILSVIVGIVAVIMIIVGGFRYITSGGKQESVTAAKNTILYALIGLVIVALAQVIVKFVLQKATSGA